MFVVRRQQIVLLLSKLSFWVSLHVWEGYNCIRIWNKGLVIDLKQRLASTCKERPRQYEIERKLWAEKRMKGRTGAGSRQGHRCDIAWTKEVAGRECVQRSQTKLSPSCLLHLSIKMDTFHGEHRRRDRFTGPTRMRPQNSFIIRQPINHHSKCLKETQLSTVLVIDKSLYEHWLLKCFHFQIDHKMKTMKYLGEN